MNKWITYVSTEVMMTSRPVTGQWSNNEGQRNNKLSDETYSIATSFNIKHREFPQI